MNKLYEIIKNLSWGKYLSISTKEELKKIKNEIPEDDKIITELDIILKSTKITKKNYIALKNIIEELLENGLSKEDAKEIIDEVIKEIEDDNLEQVLDMECDRYNKFTENNPAKYITFDKNKNRYHLNYNNKIMKSKDLQKLIQILKENLGDDKRKLFSKIIPFNDEINL